MNNHNAEGYPDPTAAEALARVEREEEVKQYNQIVYICSPYAGDIEYNVNRAKGYCRFAVSKGYIPFASHLLYPQFMEESDMDERELGLSFALTLLTKCSELWVFGDRISSGMAQEIKKANQRGIPVRCFSNKCEEVTVWKS